ncbi:gp177 [Sphingomonas phage PAU]|uniref:gp177 n=1 Tax=Sphingomonas phage PAU TaxID=1150991 RepID=UPI00025732FD|nr:gp177 [Sphingomonas phage PAU]AFF28175.1 gp177 [Sphingomonas phage PAU]
MKELRIKLDWLISPLIYVFNALFFPILIKELQYNLRIYKQCIDFIKHKIQNDENFIKFLDNHEFEEAWFGRLYAQQTIPEQLARNLSDDDLHTGVLQNLAEKHEFLVNQGFLEILIMKTKRIDRENYLLILEIANFQAILSIVYHLIFSLILWTFIGRIIYVFYLNELISILEPIKNFFIHIF